MEEQKKSPIRYQYQIPSRLNVEDKVVSLGPFSLTLRQTLILILASCIALNVWRSLGASMLPAVFCAILAAIPVVIGFFWGVVKFSGRYTEAWLIILWRYLSIAKVYHWQHSMQPPFKVPTQNHYFSKKRRKNSFGVDEESE